MSTKLQMQKRPKRVTPYPITEDSYQGRRLVKRATLYRARGLAPHAAMFLAIAEILGEPAR